MNKKELRQIEDIEMILSDGINFILSERTQITRKFGDNFVPINKLGSELCQIFNAQRDLRKLIDSKIKHGGN